LLRRYAAERARGITAQDVADSLGVPLSSIYRWIEADKKARSEPTKSASLMTVSDAIEKLCSQGNDLSDKMEALFHFISWLRWPTKLNDHSLMVTSCITSYFEQTRGPVALSDLKHDDQKMLMKYLRLDVLRRMCSSDFVDYPVFENFPLDGQKYDDRDLLATIVAYLLEQGKSADNSRNSASLNKAFYLNEKGAFRYTWYVSRRTMTTFWAQHSAAAPFAYIDKYHSPFDFSLDPQDEHFANDIDRILSAPADLKTYFQRCRWAVETLTAQLDPRALAGTHFPQFPSLLAAEPTSPPRLTPLIKATLREYRSA
jgi:hypothetical protein